MKFAFEFTSPTGRVDTVISDTRRLAIIQYCQTTGAKAEFVIAHFKIKNKGRA